MKRCPATVAAPLLHVLSALTCVQHPSVAYVHTCAARCFPMSKNSPTPLSHSLYSVEEAATTSRVLTRGKEGRGDKGKEHESLPGKRKQIIKQWGSHGREERLDRGIQGQRMKKWTKFDLIGSSVCMWWECMYNIIMWELVNGCRR